MLSGFEISLITLFLVIIQSIIGVGILVIGTPFYLYLNYEITEVILILLPISITCSLTNLIFFRFFKNKLKDITKYNVAIKFFLYCLPAILIGVIILKEFHSLINFDYVVSFVILFSLFIFKFYRKNMLSKKIEKIFLILIGAVHGFTNSGGTLLSLFFSNIRTKNASRINITIFYLFLALFQYLFTIYIFKVYNFFEYFNYNLLIIILLGVIIGNFIFRYIDQKKFKFIINLLVIISCLFLIFG